MTARMDANTSIHNTQPILTSALENVLIMSKHCCSYKPVITHKSFFTKQRFKNNAVTVCFSWYTCHIKVKYLVFLEHKWQLYL